MSKLYFKYGAMGGGKSLDLIRTYYNYKEKGLKPICLKPIIDNRSINTIESRTGDVIDCELIEKEEVLKNTFKIYNKDNCDVILIDESQFLTESQVNDIKDFCLDVCIPVICYGLKTDFTSKLFEGSKRLIEIADKQNEIKSVCWCGKKATQNARIIDGKVTVVGDVIKIGGNESYIPLCYYHFREKKVKR